MATIIELENVCKKYHRGRIGLKDVVTGLLSPVMHNSYKEKQTLSRSFFALKNVNIQINQGESVGITGKNGAGKSTLLKLIYGVATPSSGIIKTRGKIAGYLDVLSCFYQDYTARENVFLAGAFLGATKNDLLKKIDQIMEFAELEKSIDTPLRKFSSGMYLRLAFSIVINLNHEILLFDEIFAAGDAEFKAKCQKILNNMREFEKRTVLLVSHNKDLIKNVCTRVIELKEGEIISDSNL
jgi:lipopolysaccharide transport system ATP-binding protein